jgi:hypothetical protein
MKDGRKGEPAKAKERATKTGISFFRMVEIELRILQKILEPSSERKPR